MNELIRQQVKACTEQETNHFLAAATQVTIQEQKVFNELVQLPIQSVADKTLLVDNVVGLCKWVQAALQKMTAEDDVETFLTVFESVEEQKELPQQQWAEVLAPFFTRDSQKA